MTVTLVLIILTNIIISVAMRVFIGLSSYSESQVRFDLPKADVSGWEAG